MNNYRIIIDAAHGGEDVGCLLSNIPEKNITLELSKYMYQKFQEYNVPVSMVRDHDETIPPAKRLQIITERYGDHKQVIVISNHIKNQKDYEIIYGIQQPSQLSNRIASYLIKNQEQVKSYSKHLGLNPNLDYYWIHRNVANMQVLRITYPFMQNRGDLDKGVEQIVNAIYEYIGGRAQNDFYKVVQGDTLWNVAKKFHIDVDTLKLMNGFTDNLLRTGESIKVKESKEITYIVGKGENLYQICKKYDIKLEELMKYNHKKSNLVQMGEKLLIPIHSTQHKVQKGENLYMIAKKYKIDVKELMEKNHLTESKLKVGDIITI